MHSAEETSSAFPTNTASKHQRKQQELSNIDYDYGSLKILMKNVEVTWVTETYFAFPRFECIPVMCQHPAS